MAVWLFYLWMKKSNSRRKPAFKGQGNNIYPKIVSLILIHTFLLSQISYALPRNNLSLKSVKETSLNSDKSRLRKLASDLGVSQGALNDKRAKLPSDSSERLMAHISMLREEGNPVRLHRTLKLIAASISDDYIILMKRGRMRKEQIENTVARIAEFNPSNLNKIIRNAGREEDYYSIRDELLALSTGQTKLSTDFSGRFMADYSEQTNAFLKNRGVRQLPAGLKGNIDILNYLFKASGMKIRINVHEFTAIRSAKALIKAMGWNKRNVSIAYAMKVNEEDAKRYFPSYNIRPVGINDNKSAITISFKDAGGINIDSRRATLQYSPFKFDLPEKLSGEEIKVIKDQLHINDRKVIVLGSLSNPELGEFFEIYEKLYGRLPIKGRPLLIMGPNHKMEKYEIEIWEPLKRQGLKVRQDLGGDFENMEDANLLILNTVGELGRLYAIADIAIVGKDRNILEPAGQGIPVLYFDGYLRNKWKVNLEAKDALVKSGGAKRFESRKLKKLLNNKEKASSMGDKGLKVVRDFKESRIPEAADRFASLVLKSLFETEEKMKRMKDIYDDILIEEFGAAQGVLHSSNESGNFGPANIRLVSGLLEKIGIHGKNFVDLGSGDGRIAAVAALLGANAIGIEKDPLIHSLALKAEERLEEEGIVGPEYIELINKDIFDASLGNKIRDADVIFYYVGSGPGIERIIAKVGKENKKPDTLIILYGTSALNGVPVELEHLPEFDAQYRMDKAGIYVLNAADIPRATKPLSSDTLSEAKNIYTTEYHIGIPSTIQITTQTTALIPIYVPFDIKDDNLLKKAEGFLSRRIGELQDKYKGITIELHREAASTEPRSDNFFVQRNENQVILPLEVDTITNPAQVRIFTDSLLEPYVILKAMEMGIIAKNDELKKALESHITERFEKKGDLYTLPLTLPSLKPDEVDRFYEFI